ncbi:MAG: dTMP kinase [Candidatus Omnitrophota bacterium]
MKKKQLLKKGLFITFEGPEGSGKSTHSRLIADLLRREGFNVVFTREPGGTVVGDKIRGLLLDSKKIDMTPLTETLLFEASRSELITEVIGPALRARKIVICDRFNDATLAYQGYAGRIPIRDIKTIESVSMKGILPDLTIILDIGADEGLKKISVHKRDRMESKKLSFHTRVRNGYLSLARQDRKRIKVVRTMKRREDTLSAVQKEVLDVVQRYKRSSKRP